MSETSNIDKFQILTDAYDSWTVEFRIPEEELLNQKLLLTHLRSVKKHISETQTVSEQCLIFDGIVRKTNKDRYVDVVVKIRKLTVPSGAPKVTFKDEEITADLLYSHMHAFLDAYYLDEFGDLLTTERVLRAVRAAGVIDDMLDLALLNTTVKTILDTQAEARDIPIAHGKLPGTGKDAEIEFFFQAVGDSNNLDLLYSTRRAGKGDLLCRKIPPVASKQNGMNVLGRPLEPKEGFDIGLIAGSNSTLSLDGLNITADCDGVVVITRAIRKVRFGRQFKEVPDSVKIKVDPILKIDASSLSELVTAQAVEVNGNLRVGTRIMSEGEVFVNGNVEAGASITAADDILVKGAVSGASLSSQGNIMIGQDVSSAAVHARGNVDIAGHVVDSQIDGESVKAKSAAGGKIVAQKSVTLETVGSDDTKIVTTISVGAKDFFEQRLKENHEFLDSAISNLERIRTAVGDDIFESTSASNSQVVFMKLLTKFRLGRNFNVQSRVEAYRQLIEAIIPTKELIKQKEDECAEIKDRITSRMRDEDNIIVVREKFYGRVVLNVDSVKGELGRLEHGAEIRAVDGKLSVSKSKWKLA
ncbi:MAG: DUF342 domain-containing protein [Calditrichaeota bacterium]|nr:DUF342 domain-containing protein [Calditrichota bacterium]